MADKRKASSLSLPVNPVMPMSKIADLPAYREQIIQTIRRNPGKRAKALSRILREESIVNVRWCTLHDYLAREDLYAVAARPIREDRNTVATTMPDDTAAMAVNATAMPDAAAATADGTMPSDSD